MIFALAIAAAAPQSASAFVDSQMASVKMALAEWLECRAGAELRFRDTEEPAETIADGVLGACSNGEEKLKIGFLSLRHRDGTPMYDGAGVEQLIANERASARTEIIAHILDFRTGLVTK